MTPSHSVIIYHTMMVMKFFCFLFNSGIYGLPKRNGKLKDISKFDATFFGVHAKQAHTMDPQLRLLLEVSYEAILDGGKQRAWNSLFKNPIVYELSVQKQFG